MVVKRKIKTRVKSRTSTSDDTKTKTAKKRVASKGKAPDTSKAFDRGATGFKKAKGKRERQEEDYQKRKETPFDFFIKPGEDAEVVILDKEEPFFVSLHKVKGAGGRWEDEVCIADTGQACPLCESTGKEGAYTMVLTILDRRPYKTREGKVIKVSKKLFKVKGRNLPKFERQYKKLNGVFRGLKLHTARDGDKDAAVGEDLDFLGRIKESALEKFKELAEPADYKKIFEIPSAADMRKRHQLGKSSVAGAEDLGDDDEYDMDDVDGWDS
jgi:hypothetical protein